MANYKSRYTGEEIDAGIAKANTAIQEHQDISGKQDTLISGTSIKTINNQSLLGSGNITIEGGGGTANYNELANKPQINGIELTGNKSSSDLGIMTNTVSNLVNYYLKSETYTKQEVRDLISSIETMHYEVVEELPTVGESNIIYLVPKEESEESDFYDVYIYANNTWEKIGGTQIDLSNYVTNQQLTQALNEKQDTLVSGTNIKTINGDSVLGEGNITISGGGIGFSCWKNKTAVCVGDSITAGSGTTQIYYNILKDMLNLTSVQGMGIAGSCVSATSNYGTKQSPLINRYQNIPDKDLITIFMGTNDYGHNTPMGTIADTTDVSFYGALNVIIPGILTAHPNSRLVWITPTHRDKFGSGFTHDWVANGAGNTLQDYVNAIKDVCARYSVPVIDLFSISGLNPVIAGIKSTYMPDGLHPNALGHQKIAVYMAKYLNLYSEFLPEEGQVVNVTGISLNNSTLILQTGTQGSLVASISPANATNKNVTWEITSGSNLCTITPNGLNCSITAGNTAGTVTIRVKTEDGNYTASCEVTITSSSVPVTGVELSGIDIINVGASSTLTAIISPSNATNKNVTWTITSGSEYVTLTPNGATCTVEGIAEGSADITVTTQDGNFSDTMTVTVQPAPVLEWELDYGNRYSGQPAQQTDHVRLSPKAANYYFEAGTVLTLIDNVNYKWNVTPQNNEDSFNTSTWIMPGGWVTTQTCTIPSSGYYGVAILKSNNTNFDFSVDSNNAFDYISMN